MEKTSHTKPLSQQEVDQLRKNPYVKKATSSTVIFTEDFKKHAYEKIHSGVTAAEVMRQVGIDPEVLGRSRVNGFAYVLNKKARTGAGFTDHRTENYPHPSEDGTRTVDDRIKHLENELAYTRQEVEFLKKLRAADMEAQRQWESRHRQK